MKRNSNGCATPRRAAWNAIALVSIAAATPAFTGASDELAFVDAPDHLAFVGAPDDKVEKFEKVDPYTRGQRKEIDRAGYVSLGPFPLAEGIKTGDVEEALGSIPVLWVETAHFKLGSTLATYRCVSDERERRMLHDETQRLARKIPQVHEESKLDPWLRLHLFAQRLEEEYADFESRFNLSDDEFSAKANPDPTRPDYMGPGPYLGQPMKFTVLLTQKSSQVARFAKRWLSQDDAPYYEAFLPGGSVFLGTSAEAVKNGMGTELDSGLHALVAAEVARNLCFAFRGSRARVPVWFAHGVAICYSRKVDERWSMFVQPTSPGVDDDSWHWEPRVSGLVANDFVPKWDDMFAWTPSTKLEPAQHMTAWSRVAWLMTLDKSKLHAFLMSASQDASSGGAAENQAGTLVAHHKAALQTAFGKTPAELDQAWRKWVVRTYPRK